MTNGDCGDGGSKPKCVANEQGIQRRPFILDGFFSIVVVFVQPQTGRSRTLSRTVFSVE